MWDLNLHTEPRACTISKQRPVWINGRIVLDTVWKHHVTSCEPPWRLEKRSCGGPPTSPNSMWKLCEVVCRTAAARSWTFLFMFPHKYSELFCWFCTVSTHCLIIYFYADCFLLETGSWSVWTVRQRAAGQWARVPTGRVAFNKMLIILSSWWCYCCIKVCPTPMICLTAMCSDVMFVIEDKLSRSSSYCCLLADVSHIISFMGETTL